MKVMGSDHMCQRSFMQATPVPCGPLLLLFKSFQNLQKPFGESTSAELRAVVSRGSESVDYASPHQFAQHRSLGTSTRGLPTAEGPS